MRAARQMLPLIGALIALVVLFSVWVPNGKFLTKGNLLDLADQISVNAILAFGMALTILIGGIDLSVGSVVALAGTLTVYLLAQGTSHRQDPTMLCGSIAAGLGVAALFGMFNGAAAARTKMPAFIITLATMMIARGLAKRFNQGQPIGVPEEYTAFITLGTGRWWGVPVPVYIMLVMFVLTGLLLHQTRFGQHLYAIGGNREAARFTGIPVARVEMVVYMICGTLAGVAGIIQAAALRSAEPGGGIGFELSAIAAAVVGGTSFTGGKGTIYGTLLGAVIIGVLNKGLNMANVHHSYQDIVKGLVIFVAVYLDVRRRR